LNLRLKLIIMIILLCVLLFCFLRYQNRHLTVSQYEYFSSKITPELDGFRIVQLSDLHNAKIGENNSELAARIRSLQPNLIVITGDLVDSKRTHLDTALSLVAQLADICPICYSTGNHEQRLPDDEQQALFAGLEDLGVILLRNEAATITRDGASFTLIGIDDATLRSGNAVNTIKELSAGQPEDALFVVLAHEPHYFADYCEAGAQLVLCGHAHGGQFRLPLIGAVFAPGQGFLPPYTAGEIIQGSTEMIVSRGIGNSGFPFRLFNYPDLVCIDLRAMNQ